MNICKQYSISAILKSGCMLESSGEFPISKPHPRSIKSEFWGEIQTSIFFVEGGVGGWFIFIPFLKLFLVTTLKFYSLGKFQLFIQYSVITMHVHQCYTLDARNLFTLHLNIYTFYSLPLIYALPPPPPLPWQTPLYILFL